MTTITDLIRELREQEAKATPGEWYLHAQGVARGIYTLAIDHSIVARAWCYDGECDLDIDPTDAALIVAMRNALPRLLERMERLEDVLVYAVDYAKHDKRLADAIAALEDPSDQT